MRVLSRRSDQSSLRTALQVWFKGFVCYEFTHLGECLGAYLPDKTLIWSLHVRESGFRYPPRKFLVVKSGIRENFACVMWNPGNFCLWNPKSGKFLLVKSGIREIFARVIRNPVNFCLWNPETKKFLLLKSRIPEIFAREIRNLGNFCL